MGMPEIICLVTARKGSKRLEDKNRLMVGGSPLWRRAAFFGMTATRFDVVIDTDHEGIYEQASKEGFFTHKRTVKPEEQGGTHLQAIQAAADAFNAKTVILLQPTSPFRLQRIMANILEGFDGINSAITVNSRNEWDGNIAMFNVTGPVITDNPKRFYNPHPYTLQIDVPADYADAIYLETILPLGGRF